MKRREFLTKFPKKMTIGIASIFIFRANIHSTFSGIFSEKFDKEKDSSKILMEIYKEVRELGHYEGDHFIKREFFMDLDGDRKNKEEHVVFLNYTLGDREEIVVQVTYFDSKMRGSFIRYAKETREILCTLQGDRIEIDESDYDKSEMTSLLSEVLKGIRSKKMILKLLKK